MWALYRTTIRNIVFIGATLSAFPANVHAYDGSPASGASGRVHAVAERAERNDCDAKPVGKITVATLSNVPIVTLSANGHPVTLLLDTGAERTVLTPAVAERIGGQPPRVEFDRRMRGIAGTLPTREVELHSFAAGALSIPWRRVVVAPVTTAMVFPTPLDGMLGADVLSNFDIDLDLAHQQMTLYEKRSCPLAPPWTGPFAAVSTGRSHGDHLFFPVQLDGRGVVAIVDTGAQLSTLSATAARALGLTETALAHDRPITAQGATAERLSSHLHRFTQLKVGDEIIPNPELVVTDVKFRDADLVLGVDYLRSHRIWMSYGSLQIFLSRQ